jgi:hypothetical protein
VSTALYHHMEKPARLRQQPFGQPHPLENREAWKRGRPRRDLNAKESLTSEALVAEDLNTSVVQSI